jgi:hypothetical protein
MTARQRFLLWSGAIEKAKSLWGEDWGLAINGQVARSQCHAHTQEVGNDNFDLLIGPIRLSKHD